ncbi:MAG: hypothetical protein ACE5NA_11540 [Nitrospiraceae bacterium]
MSRAFVKPIFALCVASLLVATSSYAAQREKNGKSIVKKGTEDRITKGELQDSLMAFADRFGSTIVETAEVFENREGSARARLVARRMKVFPTIAVIDIAAGPNPAVSLLDMLVLVTLNRMVWEEYWKPKVFGEPADLMIKAWRNLEANIWSIANRVLTSEQQDEMVNLIKEWRDSNRDIVAVAFIRFDDFAESRRKSALEKAAESGGFLGIKGATRAMDEARFLGERAMFLLTRMMILVPFQIELVYQKMVTEPAVEQLLSDTTTLPKAIHQQAKAVQQVAKAMDQTAKALEELPKQIAQESEAAITHLAKEYGKAIAKTEEQAEAFVDYAFPRNVALIVIFLIGSVLAGLIYRFVSVRLIGSGQARGA